MSEQAGLTPARGDVWLVSLGTARTGELGKDRPAVIVSRDELRTGSPYDHLIVIPLSASRPPTALQPSIPPDVGLERPCVAMCDRPRSVGVSRFLRYLGSVSPDTMRAIVRARATIEGWDGLT